MASPALALSVHDAVTSARRSLAGSQSSGLDAELLLAYVLGRCRVWVLTHDDACLSEDETRAFGNLVSRRAEGVPVAYLRGMVEWNGMTVEVTPDVLIPRPETELLLERALDVVSRIDARRIADIGTGSGALAAGLARVPGVTVTAVDVSRAGLEVAERNVRHLVPDVLRVALKLGDLITPLTECPDLIVANLPYLPDHLMETLPADVRHEPELALRGGTDGLHLYDRLMAQLRARGWHPPLLIEIDPSQSELLSCRYPGYRVMIAPDYSGRDRVALLEPK